MILNKFKLDKDAAMALYLMSMVFPALYLDHEWKNLGDGFHRGYYIFFLGIFSIPDGTLAWLANPLFIYSYFTKDNINSAISSAISVIIATSSILYKDIWDDGGGRIHITGYGIGFYLWISSFILLTYISTKKYYTEEK